MARFAPSCQVRGASGSAPASNFLAAMPAYYAWSVSPVLSWDRRTTVIGDCLGRTIIRPG